MIGPRASGWAATRAEGLAGLLDRFCAPGAVANASAWNPRSATNVSGPGELRHIDVKKLGPDRVRRRAWHHRNGEQGLAAAVEPGALATALAPGRRP